MDATLSEFSAVIGFRCFGELFDSLEVFSARLLQVWICLRRR